MKSPHHSQYFLSIIGALITLAWVTLWIWEQSPYGRYLNHSELGTLSFEAGFDGILGQATFYVAGWTLMTVAMMLPTSLPLIEIFRRLTRRRPDHKQLLSLLVAGYLSIWLFFGVFAHLADLVLHEAYELREWLQSNAWVFGAGPLVLAGVFQFTKLKYRCLDKCRAPMGFVIEHWRGGNERMQALVLGIRHGLFCVGCCWALMFVMFAVGTGNVGWMLLLGAIMAIEKNTSWGKKFSTPLGISLLLWGGLIILDHSLSWNA